MSDAAEVTAEEKTLVEVFKSFHAQVKVIRDRHGCSIAEAIQQFGGPGIEREYRRVVKEMHDELHPVETGEAGA